MFNEEKIKSFSTTDMRIYNYILKHSIQFPYMSIRELADEIPTSTASIMRFVKKMGYDSFPELKYAYKKEEKEVSLHMVNDIDEIIDCLKKFNTPYYQDLFKEVAYILGNANMIIFDGMGDSGKIAEYAARHFSINGFFSAALTDPYQRVSMDGTDIVVVMLSVSGNTPELIWKANGYKAAGSTLITITASDDNTLAKMSDHNISYYINDVRTEDMSHTTQVPALSIIEILSNITQRMCHNSLQ